MAVYTVYEHATKGPDHTVFVKEGFSGMAFVFSVLWALWHRMWVVAAILLIVFAALSIATHALSMQDGIVSILNLGISLVFGHEAQDLRAKSLRRAGYREAGLVMAKDLEEAELKYAFAMPKQQSRPLSSRPLIGPPTDTLGLFGNV